MLSVKCAKCSGEMEIGFVADPRSSDYVMPMWISGHVNKSFWGFLRTKGRKQLWVDVLRCTGCGYLESYANQSSK